MSYSNLCAEVVWKIENFSYCWQENGEGLFSPVVSVESLRGSKWRLQLYPKGRDLTNTNDTSLYLYRRNDSSVMADFNVKYEFAVLDAKDCPLEGNTYQHTANFKSNSGFGFLSFIKKKNLDEKKEYYLPQDVLTIQCKIWSEDSYPSKTPTFLLRTHIPVNECIFSWSINEAFGPSAESKISFTFPLKEDKTVSVDLQQVFHQNKKHVNVNINGDIETMCSWKCEFRFVDTGEAYLLCEDKFDQASIPYCKLFQPLLLFPSTADKKQSHLKFKLRSIFAIVLHDLNSCQESRIYYKHEKIYGYSITTTSKIDDEGKIYSLQQDVCKTYSDGFLSDFNVKVEGKIFPVQFLILAARSPVLKCMLESNMKESSNKTLKLDDLDESTVTQMLDYMYTDDTGKLCTDSALKLYYAGDKYDIPGIKKKMSIFLKSNVSCSNVCDILELADRHRDEHLKSTAVEFIFNNEMEMLKSDEFRNLSKQNPELFFETTFSLAKLRTSS